MQRACLALVAAALALAMPFARGQSPTGNGAEAETAATPAAPPGPAAPSPRPRPYRDVLKDAVAQPGHFTLHRKDDKVWIELRPAQFEVPLFFSFNITRSIGERGLYGNQMGRSHVAFFRRSGERVQLVARNEEFFAARGTPQARFVEASFTDSLIASAPVVSLPDPDNGAVLIEAGALLIADIPGYLTRLETAFRMPFALDARNSTVARVNNSAQQTVFYVRAHYAVPKIPAPPLKPPAQALPPPPKATPDPRSAFVTFQYSLAQLPAEPMAPRLADPRVGHFTVARVDHTDDTSPKARVHYVTRWRLEKQDPAAAISPVKQPILFWLDRNIPQKYRKSVADGVLEWNQAFERIGLRDAIVVRQQLGEDDIDRGEARRAVVRWFTGADVGFAIGPSLKDPRSGETLAADIGMSDVFARSARRLVAEDLGRSAGDAGTAAHGLTGCSYAADAAHELHFASDLLEARGIAMDGPEADALAQAYVKDTIMHEVGHVLGLRHNFRASTVYRLEDLRDPEFTRRHGMATSVMDYTPYNLALQGETQGEYRMSTIGPYDYWAIEYAYRPLDPGEAPQALAKIAARSTEPALAYGTDEDAGSGARFPGMDPEVNRFDLGPDPLAYYRRRLRLSRELWDRLQALRLAPGESYERLTRSLANGFRDLTRTAPLAAKYVGGVTHRRDFAGTGRALYDPVPAARQREALAVIADDFFSPGSFRFAPELLSRIAIDHFERPPNPFVSVADSVIGVQKTILDHLLSDTVAARLLESPDRATGGTRVLSLAELHDRLQAAIWSEALAGREVELMRRNLQREHLRRVAGVLIKPAAGTPADAVALLRDNARRLAAALRRAQAKPGLSRESRLHYAESRNTLEEALRAPLQRAAP
ncbi:MAG: DUF5117 domain-containing protein [Betaproteobacteria bacterium]|nr:MAG: DUF5117 domain-containing protein [Betaproteobacteria bacterium]